MTKKLSHSIYLELLTKHMNYFRILKNTNIILKFLQNTEIFFFVFFKIFLGHYIFKTYIFLNKKL